MILVGDWSPGEKQGYVRLKGAPILLNLEGPLLSLNHDLAPIQKAGPHLFSVSLPLDEDRYIFTLANNHIMDYGVAGLDATLTLLKHHNFKMVGAGRGIVQARSPLIVEDAGVRVGIISCCEAQFGIARYNGVGVAEMGPWIYQAIKSLTQKVDMVVISVHAAVEDSPWPSPYIQELYRSFIEAGASVVHGHHAHVPQGVEVYGHGIIFYGLGNFMVDPDLWSKTPNTLWSVGARINFKTTPLSFDLLTFEVRSGNDNRISVEESTDEERKLHLRYLQLCNQPLANAELLEALWQETALRAYFCYGASYMQFPDAIPHKVGIKQRLGYIREGVKKAATRVEVGKVRKQATKNDYLLWYVIFSCQSHQKVMATALGLLSGEVEDLRTPETRQLADEMMPWSVGRVPE